MSKIGKKTNKEIHREHSRKKFWQFFSNYNALGMSEQNMKKMKKYEKAKQRASFFLEVAVNLKKMLKHFRIFQLVF